MQSITVSQYLKKRKKLLEDGKLTELKAVLRSGGKITPSKALLVRKPKAHEVMRFVIGKQFFVLFYKFTLGLPYLMLESIDVDELHIGNPISEKSKVLGSCSKIIQHEGRWLFTKSGHYFDSFELKLNDKHVMELAAFLGFELKGGGRFPFSIRAFKRSKAMRYLAEWADENQSLADRLNEGDHTKGIFNT